MKINSIVLLLVVSFLACKENKEETTAEKFDKVKWAVKEDQKYPYRDKMLNDLFANEAFKDFNKMQVLQMLGAPNRTDSNYLFYTINQQLLVNVFPLHTKTLVVKFGTDSTVEWRKIHE